MREAGCLVLLILAVGCWRSAASAKGAGALLLPVSVWPVLSSSLWLAYLLLNRAPSPWDKRHALWGITSAALLAMFLAHDPEFQGWGDVYYFCGSRMQYCTCAGGWNAEGWGKAALLCSFVLSLCLGLNRLLLQLVLRGLLPGEEVVTRDSFISIAWRLVPYLLNEWEQKFGAEVSSALFELPQFALELLVVLPCVQILASRMKVLALTSLDAALPAAWGDAAPRVIEATFVPNVLRGCWERRPEQRHFWQRIRANQRIIAMASLLCVLAFGNALTPLLLERAVLRHPHTPAVQAAGRLPSPGWESRADLARLQQGLASGSVRLSHSFASVLTVRRHLARQAGRHGDAARAALAQQGVAGRRRRGAWLRRGRQAHEGHMADEGGLQAAAQAAGISDAWLGAVEGGPWAGNATWAADAVGRLLRRLDAHQQQQHQQQEGAAGAAPLCDDVELFRHNTLQHHAEVFRMQDPHHLATTPLVEAGLVIMRLSTEHFFVLLSLYVAFLLFRTPPRAAALLVAVNARVSAAVMRVILYAFPLVCWTCGAGVLFSSLVSAVFWGSLAWQLYDAVHSQACRVAIRGLRPASAEEVARMHGDCAVCWQEMTVNGRGREEEEPGGGGGGGGAGGEQAPAGQPATTGSRMQLRSSAAAARAAAAGSQEAAAGADGAGGVVGQQPPDGGAPAAAQVAPPPPLEAGSSSSSSSSSGGGGRGGRPHAGPLAPSDGSTLACGHCYHRGCLTQWMQQCHRQGTPPKCPMCAAPLSMEVTWHLGAALRAALGATVSLGQPRGRQARAGGGAGAGENGPAGQQQQQQQQQAGGGVMNNYLLRHNPRLADLLADMPHLLAPDIVQLLAEVQDLRGRRQELFAELQLAQHQLAQVMGRQQRLELEGLAMEEQRRQLLREVLMLMQMRDDQVQLLAQQQQQRQEQEQRQQEQEQQEQQQQQQQDQPEQPRAWRPWRQRAAGAQH